MKTLLVMLIYCFPSFFAFAHGVKMTEQFLFGALLVMTSIGFLLWKTDSGKLCFFTLIVGDAGICALMLFHPEDYSSTTLRLCIISILAIGISAISAQYGWTQRLWAWIITPVRSVWEPK